MAGGDPEQSGRRDRLVGPIDAASAVGPGRFDAAALLTLWTMRCAVPAILIAGVMYAWLVTGRGFTRIPEVGTIAQAWRVLVSPFVGLAIAVILRIMVGLAALALAYPHSRRATGSTAGSDLFRRSFRVWSDRWHLVSAYRSLRWTSTVRKIAASRLGRWGTVLNWSGPVLLVIDILLVIALLAVVWLNPITPA